MKVFVKTLREKSRGILILMVLFLGFALYTAAMFPAMGEDMLKNLDRVLDIPAFKAFGKSVSTLTAIEGLFVVEIYQWMIELLLAGYVVLFAASFVSGEIEKKTIDVLLANPISRTRILLEKYLALVVMITMVNVALFIGVATGIACIGEETDVTWLAYTHVMLMPFLLAVGSYSTFLSVLFDDSRKVMSVGLGILFGTFFLDSISLMAEKYAFVSKVTLFHYFDPGETLVLHKIEWNHVVVLCVVAVVLLLAAVEWFNKRDINIT